MHVRRSLRVKNRFGRRFRFSQSKQNSAARISRRPPGTGATIQWAELFVALFRLKSLFLMQVYAATKGSDVLAELADLVRTHPDIKRDPFANRQLRRMERQFRALRRMSDTPSFKIDVIAELERAWLEMLICKVVDAFEFYLGAVLRRCLKKNPAAIPDASIRVQDLLNSTDISDAIDRIIDKQVYDASFTGLPGIADYLERRFGTKIDRKTASYAAVLEVIEVRHLIVHNGSRVSKRFLERTKLKLARDALFPVSRKYILDAVDAVLDVSEELDGLLLAQAAV